MKQNGFYSKNEIVSHLNNNVSVINCSCMLQVPKHWLHLLPLSGLQKLLFEQGLQMSRKLSEKLRITWAPTMSLSQSAPVSLITVEEKEALTILLAAHPVEFILNHIGSAFVQTSWDKNELNNPFIKFKWVVR